MADSATNADLLTAHIKESFLNDIESLKSVDGRKTNFAKLQEKHPNVKFTKVHYNNILKREIKRIGKDPREFGLTARVPTFTKPNSSIGGKTEPKPKQVTQTPYPKETPSPESGKPQVTGQPQVAGQHTPATQEQIQELAQQIQFNFNAKNTGAMIKALYGGIKFIYQDLESLDDDEKEDLAELWIPFCQKYLQSDYAIIIVPLMASSAILAPKIRKAREVKKKRQEKEEQKQKSGELT